jgi:putative transposase
VTFLCHYYGVSKSGYYAWKHRPVSGRTRANEKLLKAIHRIHERSYGIYGSPRVWEALKAAGVSCSENGWRGSCAMP